MTLACVFPGQGSQSLGMLQDIFLQYDCVKVTLEEASDVLHYDVWQLMTEGPLDQLNQTRYTQPVMMAADIAYWRLWCALHEERPILLAGHSLGEFAALVAAESVSFKDGLSLVATRGELMQSAVPEGTGAMAAIVGLEDDQVRSLCDEGSQGDVLAPANYNSLGQIVVAGKASAVERVVALATRAGARLAKIIPVSVPSHCALMEPAEIQFKKHLMSVHIHKPTIPVIQNVDAAVHDDIDDIRGALIAQLTQPVQWVATIQKMHCEGVTDIVECGPGKVLTGLIKRIHREIKFRTVNEDKQ